MKTCHVCYQPKPLTEYYKHKKAKDGYGYVCKECSRARSKRWNQENKERVNENNRRYWQNHATEKNQKRNAVKQTEEGRARRAAQRRAYYAKNKQKDLEASKAWRESEAGKSWKAEYTERTRERRRVAYVQRKYGLNPTQYQSLMESQKGVCAICKETPKGWAVDHDHQTGAVRGLLCNACNWGLGQFTDDPK